MGFSKKLEACTEYIKGMTEFVPRVGVTLGSGLNGYADNIDVVKEIKYSEIPGFPVSTAPGHDGRFIFGYVKGVPVVAMRGRVHYYEGYEIPDVVLPTRLLCRLGIEKLILTNAAGGINEGFNVGDFMIIRDHISSFVPTPLRDCDRTAYGDVFADMSDVYDTELSMEIKAVGEEQGIRLHEGVYVQTTGPQYETKAEIRMFRSLGADAVGMSTVVEAIAAHQMGVKVCGISCITNLACGMSEKPLSGDDVNETAGKAAGRFEKLVSAVIERIGK